MLPILPLNVTMKPIINAFPSSKPKNRMSNLAFMLQNQILKLLKSEMKYTITVHGHWLRIHFSRPLYCSNWQQTTDKLLSIPKSKSLCCRSRRRVVMVTWRAATFHDWAISSICVLIGSKCHVTHICALIGSFRAQSSAAVLEIQMTAFYERTVSDIAPGSEIASLLNYINMTQN